MWVESVIRINRISNRGYEKMGYPGGRRKLYFFIFLDYFYYNFWNKIKIMK